MKKYRWGILGTGKIANRFAEALNNIPNEAEFAAVGSRSQETADKFAKKYNATKTYKGYEALAADPEIDIIYIGTPGAFHHQDVTMALESGKHVLCEKALTLNATEAKSIIDLARSKKRFLMEAMWTRFFPLHVKIRELVDQGAIGDVRGINTNFCATAPPGMTNRFWDINLGASTLLDIGSYGISLASSLFGKPEEAIGLAYMGEAGFDYQSSCVLKYGGGRIATVMTSFTSVDVKTAVIFGTKGKIEIDDPWYKPTSMTLFQDGESPKPMEFPLDGFNGYEYEIREVIACIEKGDTESTIMPLDESLQEMETMDSLRAQWGFKFPMEQ
jgi:predicted dehydrogenase